MPSSHTGRMDSLCKTQFRCELKVKQPRKWKNRLCYQKNTQGYVAADDLMSMVHQEPTQLSHKRTTKTGNGSENGQR